LSLAAEIISMAEEQVPVGCILSGITLTVGALSGVNPDSLTFCLESSLPDEVRISVNSIAARLNCLECGRDYTTGDMYEPCPSCGSLRRKVVSGRNLTVDSIETLEGNEG